VKPVRAVDLFCGAGGTSSGLVAACRQLQRPLDLLAINHWSVAIDTHSRNLPGVRHLCADVTSVDPRAAVPGGRLDLLVASPECKYFSTARGGRPILDQKRADPWQVVRWASELRIDTLLIENVPEFRAWGPLDAGGRPIKRDRGKTYATYLAALRGLGYAVEARVLRSADYGDPTTRRRLFILARRGKRVRWPQPTHAPAGTLLPGMQSWKTARDHVIDWSIPGESIFGRKKPLARNTVARIVAGLQRFAGPELGPFLVVLRGTDPEHLRRSAKPIDLPLPAVCASTSHFGLVEAVVGEPAFLLSQQSGGAPRSTREPVPTVATRGAISLVETAFVLPPLGVHHRNGKANKPRSTDEPLQTVTSRGGGHLVQSVIVPRYGERDGQKPRAHSVDVPLPTVPASCQHQLAQAVLVHVNHGDNPKGSGRGNGGRAQSLDRPAPTITSGGRGLALVEALIAQYYGQSGCRPVSEPLPTVTAKDRFGLVTFDKAAGGLALDIRFRMLRPHELARAQGLGHFTFTGTVEDQVCQIGNAVTHELATALCVAALT
jgi:DNA (cytosine-5)-methyltransferase 1